MWKKLSFKKQLIIILLIPIAGLLYFNITILSSTYNDYLRIENSLEKLKVITDLSRTKNLINDERILYEY